MYETDLIIGDKDQPASDCERFERRNPVTDRVVTRAASATVADARAAADAAAAAFPAWSEMGPTRRRHLLQEAARVLSARTGEVSEAMQSETGASENWTRFNCTLAVAMLEEAAASTTQVQGTVLPSDRPGSLSMAVRAPAGVCLGIAPWNAPVILAVRSVAIPLACGNTTVLKTSEFCPTTQWLVADSIRAAGVPAGTINVVSTSQSNAATVVDALIGHAAVRRVNFTGSTRVGRIVAERCASHLKPAVLGLGGKAVLVVLDDADLDAAVDAAAFGAFANQGQVCMSTERIVVDAAVADGFVARLAVRMKSLRAGPPGTPDCQLGAMISREATDRVRAMLEDAVHKGATLVTGGDADGTIMQPSLLDHVSPDMRIYRDEAFGPVAGVVRVNSPEEAVSVANDSDHGLVASVFGRDTERALAIARQIESGICHVNAATLHDEAHVPFGGMKGSGHGRFGGQAGIDAFTELRWLTVQSQRAHYAL